MGLASEYPAQITNVQLKQTFVIVGSHYWGLTCTDSFYYTCTLYTSEFDFLTLVVMDIQCRDVSDILKYMYVLKAKYWNLHVFQSSVLLLVISETSIKFFLLFYLLPVLTPRASQSSFSKIMFPCFSCSYNYCQCEYVSPPTRVQRKLVLQPAIRASCS